MKVQPPEDAHITYQCQYRKCGKSTCKCHTSEHRHGPYWYGYWREQRGRKLHSFYVGKERPLQAKGNV